ILFSLHTLIIALLFVFFMFCNVDYRPDKFIELITDGDNPFKLVYIFLALCLLTTGTFFYTYFEARDYIKDGKNINLLFFILEVSLLAMLQVNIFTFLRDLLRIAR
ncbi:MAG: hypothetical protein MJ072_04120, partial [Clostridia bacterium]|nr:hypothetical protein [Clostridia bacterium]